MAIFAKIRKNRQILKALIFKGFERYLRCIFATTCRPAVPGSCIAIARTPRPLWQTVSIADQASTASRLLRRQHASMCVVFDRKNKKGLGRPRREKYIPAGQI